MKNPVASLKGLNPLQKTALWLGIAILCYTLFGFLAAPLILKAVLEKKLPQVLGRQVAIEKIRLNPYALSAAVEGFEVARKDGEGRFVSFERLYVNLESLSVFKKALIVQAVSLNNPAIDFSRLDDEDYSFSDLLPAPSAEEPQPQAEQGPFLFSVNNIEIEGGTIIFRDMPKGTVHRIEDLRLAIPSVSSLPSSVETYVQPVFSAVINGTPVSLAGGTKPFADSRATEVELKMSGINIPEYLAYIPNPTGLTVKSALLDIDTKLAYLLMDDQTSRLALTGAVSLRELEVTDQEGRSYLRLPSLSAILADSDLLAREVRLAEIAVAAPQLELTRLAGGEILPLALLSPSDDGPSGEPAEAPGAEEASADPVTVTIDRIRLDKGEVTFIDRSLESPATIKVDGIDLEVNALSTVPGTASEIAFSLGLNETGRLSGQGSLVLSPLEVKTTLGLHGLQLADFQPYVAEHARVLLAGGTLALQGDLEVRPDAAGSPGLFFVGKSSISGLATADTLSGDDLVKWKALQVGDIELSTGPFELDIDEISLQDLYAKVLITADGTVNLASLARTDRASGAESVPEGDGEAPSAGRIAIGKVALRNGQVQFLDRSVKPAYGANLGQLSGAITGLSSVPGSLAAVRLEARLDQQAPLTISGEINPLTEEPFADIKIDFKDFNLSPLSPYTGKYAGYKTGKGKLYLDLFYRLRGNRLESSNKVLLDQFTLSEKVDSPDATTLPVKLALALLKNRKGEISLDIPVAGDLNDPEFSVGGVVIKVLGNLMAKAATSPFALLGSLIPEGEDLQHVPFEPGLAELTGETVDKLAIVANVLHERPGLRLDVSGRVDRRLDSQALARSQMLKLVKLEKLKKAGAGKGEEIDYQSVLVSEEEYPRYLERAYEKAMKAAPEEDRRAARQAEPAAGAEAVARMEEFLLAGMPIGEEELRLLAIDRANAVLGHLVASGKVEPERLFAVEPQLSSPEEAEGQGSQTLVELLIK